VGDQSVTNPGKVSLRANQRRAIEVLLKSGSVSKAAEAAHVSRNTLHRWMREPAFAAALAAAEADALANLSRRLVDLGDKATDTLEEAMAYDPKAPGARVAAANSVLANLLKVRELAMLENRVAALEQAILDRGGKE
jgi:hypothetical protein